MVALAEPHPIDEGRWQATFSEYGHGEGQGKSRNAVYKHAKSLRKKGQFPEAEMPTVEISSETEKKSEKSSNSKRDTESRSNYTKSAEPDFVQNDGDSDPNWDSIEWADDEPDEPVQTRTIPKPLSDVAKGKQMEVNADAMASMIRFGYVALDRMVTHWGRGTMNDSTWTLERLPEDYDALEASTVAMLNHYGIEVPMSPVLVWGATVGAAYGPPIVYVQRHADPRQRRAGIRSFLARITSAFRRKSKKQKSPEGKSDELQY